jgi:hypothetical protein
MKIYKDMIAQGDVIVRRIGALPDGVVTRKGAEALVVAHSETGHHHTLSGEARILDRAQRDPMICYLQIDGEYADLVHRRSYDTHETVRLDKGCWEVLRQEEYTPEGWKQVQD